MILLLLLLLFSNLYGQDGISFEPIVVEEVESENIKKEITITPYPGAGTKLYKKPINKFGIEISDLENETDISNDRRSETHQLKAKFDQQKNATLLKVSQGGKQSVIVKHKGFFNLEAGSYRDFKQYNFTDNHNTPYTTSDDFENSYQIRKEHSYFSFDKGPALISYDDLKKNSIAATVVTGKSRKKRLEGNLNYKGRSFQSTLFYSNQIHDFSSLDPNLFDSKTDSKRIVLHNKYVSPFNLIANVDLSYEHWQREQLTQAKFTRSSIRSALTYSWSSNPWIETKSIADATFINDQNEKRALLNIKQEITSSTQYPVGLSALIHRFNRAPKPSQLFGDGGMLFGNQDLPIESGWRTQVGPWFKNKRFESQLQLFIEESKNTPLLVGVSPSKAKTQAIGGIWTRGFFWDSKVIWKIANLNVRYEYQLALNNSQINWQRGNPIPERPEHRIALGIELGKESWRLGSELAFEKNIYRDLAGQDLAPSNHFNSSYIAYHGKNSIYTLTISNLFLSKSQRSPRSFQDSAGTNILEPMLLKPEIQFTLEYLL